MGWVVYMMGDSGYIKKEIFEKINDFELFKTIFEDLEGDEVEDIDENSCVIAFDSETREIKGLWESFAETGSDYFEDAGDVFTLYDNPYREGFKKFEDYCEKGIIIYKGKYPDSDREEDNEYAEYQSALGSMKNLGIKIKFPSGRLLEMSFEFSDVEISYNDKTLRIGELLENEFEGKWTRLFKGVISIDELKDFFQSKTEVLAENSFEILDEDRVALKTL